MSITSRRSRGSLILASTATNAVFSLAAQLLALVTLAPSAFGLFSLQYLVFALGVSVSLSTVSEPWLRTELIKGHRSAWRDYSSALLYVSGAAALVTLVLSLIVPGMGIIAITGALAAGVNVYRAGTRYHQVRTAQWRRVLIADGAGVAMTVAVWAVLFFLTPVDRLLVVSIAWLLGGIASAAVASAPALGGPRSALGWYRTHREHIVPLLKDSLLMDVGSIATPFAIAPLLGLADFGVYRAVSNVAAPVRLVLNPLRPVLAGASATAFRSLRRIAIVFGVSTLFGAAAAGALLLIGSLHITVGSLTALSEYAVPTGVFVGANFLNLFFYMIARAHFSGRALLTGRIIQTLLAILFPIVGALLWGLSGAIWSYAIGTALAGLAWVIVVRAGTVQRPDASPSEDDPLP